MGVVGSDIQQRRGAPVKVPCPHTVKCLVLGGLVYTEVPLLTEMHESIHSLTAAEDEVIMVLRSITKTDGDGEGFRVWNTGHSAN